ncbi:MAG: thioredoxin family protein [Actinobacteria bacterium]|nr:thioredoxin family protein [Actinomycetota bacterium]
MKTFLPLAIVLGLSSAYGIWYRASRGKIKGKNTPSAAGALVHLADLEGASFGSRVTLLQFSSAFCSPCRATRALLTDITADMADVAHIDIDAEGHLELVRRLDIRSTPTTLILDGNQLEVGRAVGAPKRDQVLKAIAAVSKVH